MSGKFFQPLIFTPSLRTFSTHHLHDLRSRVMLDAIALAGAGFTRCSSTPALLPRNCMGDRLKAPRRATFLQSAAVRGLSRLLTGCVTLRNLAHPP